MKRQETEMRNRRKYTKEFKLDAVQLALKGNDTTAEIARRLGINPNMIGKWKKAYLADGQNAFVPENRITPDQDQIRRLEREVKQLRMERDILKKATALFAKESS